MEEREITSHCPLLSSTGTLSVTGWARRPYFAYNRTVYRKKPVNLRERDSYTLYNPLKGYMISLVFCDWGIRGIHMLSYTDLKLGRSVSITKTGRRNCALAISSQADSYTSFQDKDCELTMTAVRKGDERYIIFNAPQLKLPDGTEGLLGDFTLFQPGSMESLVTVSGSSDSRFFCIDESILPLPSTSGFIRRGGSKDYLVQDQAAAFFSWQRSRQNDKAGWIHAFSICGGTPFVLGSGQYSMMNAFFCSGKLTKLSQADFNHHSDPEKPWHIACTGRDGELDFIPQCIQTEQKDGLTVIHGKFSGQLKDRPIASQTGTVTVFRP